MYACLAGCFPSDVHLLFLGICTLINCTLFGGTDPLVGMIAMGLSPLYLILNSPDLDPWLISEISLAIVLLLATTLPKSTIWSTSSIGCGGYLK